ncbi:MAG: hypothetical protein J1G38_03280 [Clostridiales bacterium]|nr:hypothetical protein [Clostridiales bacterium]
MAVLPDNSPGRDKLKEEIDRLEAVKTGVRKPSLERTELSEMEYDPPSDESLRAQAENDLGAYRSQGIENIKQESAQNEENLKKNKSEYENARSASLKKLETAYGNASETVDSDILKRGLARSSIAVNEKSGLAEAYAAQSAEIMREYDLKISDIDKEISSVGAKLNKALNDFNLSYAAKLNEKLNELKAEREKKTKEVLEYNNSIREKQAKLDNERLKTESSLYSDALSQQQKATDLDNLTPEARDAVYKSVYAKMDEYLSSMSKSQAKLEFLNHTLYRDHLSDYYYYKLYDKYGR